MSRWALLPICVLAACGGGHSSATAEQRGRVRAQLDETDKIADSLDQARRAALVAASGDQPPAAPRACPAGYQLDNQGTADNFLALRRHGVPAEDYDPAPDVEQAEGLRHVVYQRRTRELRRMLDERSSTAEQLDNFAADLPPWKAPSAWHPYEITLVVTHVDPPQLVGDHGFEGGSAEGRVLVWSYDKGAIVCWAPVTVQLGTDAQVSAASTNHVSDLLGLLYEDAETAAMAALGSKLTPGRLREETDH